MLQKEPAGMDSLLRVYLIRSVWFLMFFMCTVRLYSQDLIRAEQALVACFDKITYWAQQTKLHYHEAALDSLRAANHVFDQALLTYTNQVPGTLSHPFSRLQAVGLHIATSPDGCFRVYSWDTQLGGTLHLYHRQYQYKGENGRVYSQLVENASETGGFFCSDIFMITGNNRKIYLAYCHETLTTSLAYQKIKLYQVSGNTLDTHIPLIKTRTGVRPELGFEFNIFSVLNRPERPFRLILVDPAAQTIQIPVVYEDGTVTHRSIVYVFDGQYFVRGD
ncbi:MAG: hypothetical protein SF053_14205 [Bacteroidia bacterium]|nr:hypothetical protein [Bacteroidia bacterium]